MKRFGILVALSLMAWGMGGTPCLAAAESRADAYYKYLIGIEAEQRGDLAKAQAAFEAAAELDRHSVAPLKELIDLALHQERLDDAHHWIEEALTRAPDDLDLKLLLARIAMAKGEFQEAEELITELLQKMGDDEELLFMLGNLYLKENLPEKAIEPLKRLAKGKGRRSLMALFFLGRLYTDQGRLDEAERAFKELLEEDPHLSSIYKYLARIYREQERYDDAVRAYQTLLVNHPDDAEALRELLELRIEQGSFQDHREEYARFLKLLEDNPREGLRLAAFMGTKGMFEEALEILNRIAGAFRDPGPVAIYRALILKGMGKTDQALKILRSIPEDSVFFYDARIKEALMIQEREGPGEALALLAPLIRRDDAPKRLFLAVATLYRKTGERYRAYEVLREGARRFPKDKELLMQLAMAMDNLQMRKEEIEVAKRILEEDPDYVPALNFLGYVYAEAGIHLDEAERLIRKALEQAPDDGFIIDSLGWVQFKQGRFREALKTLQRALERVPEEDPVIVEHIGDCLAALKRYYEAIKTYRKAIGLLEKGDTASKTRLLKKIAETRNKMEEGRR